MSGTFVPVYTSEPDTMKMKNYNIQRRGVLIMKCIGIIGAMEQEVARIKEKMQHPAHRSFHPASVENACIQNLKVT